MAWYAAAAAEDVAAGAVAASCTKRPQAVAADAVGVGSVERGAALTAAATAHPNPEEAAQPDRRGGAAERPGAPKARNRDGRRCAAKLSTPPVRSGEFASEREIGRSGAHRQWYAGYYAAKGKGKGVMRAYVALHGPPP